MNPAIQKMEAEIYVNPKKEQYESCKAIFRNDYWYEVKILITPTDDGWVAKIDASSIPSEIGDFYNVLGRSSVIVSKPTKMVNEAFSDLSNKLLENDILLSRKVYHLINSVEHVGGTNGMHKFELERIVSLFNYTLSEICNESCENYEVRVRHQLSKHCKCGQCHEYSVVSVKKDYDKDGDPETETEILSGEFHGDIVIDFYHKDKKSTNG